MSHSRKTMSAAGPTRSDVKTTITSGSGVEQLEYWTERMHAAEAAGDTQQVSLAKRLVDAYTFFLAHLHDEDEPPS